MNKKLVFSIMIVLVCVLKGQAQTVPNLEAVTTQGNSTTNSISIWNQDGLCVVTEPINPLIRSHYLKGSPVDKGVLRFDCTSSTVTAGWEFFNTNECKSLLYIKQNSSLIGIGTTDPKARLSVNGDVLAKKVRITPNNWSDFVFEPSYPLPSLSEVERFITQHKHLPDIPSAKEVCNNDLELGQKQADLLQKIEEMTLYIIAQEKKLNAREQRISERQQLLDDREKRLTALETKTAGK